jgi:hypothetical protein
LSAQCSEVGNIVAIARGKHYKVWAMPVIFAGKAGGWNNDFD